MICNLFNTGYKRLQIEIAVRIYKIYTRIFEQCFFKIITIQEMMLYKTYYNWKIIQNNYTIKTITT